MVKTGLMDVFEHSCCTEEGALVDAEGMETPREGLKKCVTCGRIWVKSKNGVHLYFEQMGEVEVPKEEEE